LQFFFAINIKIAVMKKILKFSLLVFVIGLVALVLGYKFIYNRPHPDFEKAKSDFSISGAELFSQFKNSSQQAASRYNGKVIEIKALLNHVETPDSLTVAVFILGEGMFGDEGIRCTMLPNYRKEIWTYEGKEIKLKGYCTGFNETDVIVESCSIVQ